MMLSNVVEGLVQLQLIYLHLRSRETEGFSMVSMMQPSIPYLFDQKTAPHRKQIHHIWNGLSLDNERPKTRVRIVLHYFIIHFAIRFELVI